MARQVARRLGLRQSAIASYRIDCRSGILAKHDLFRKPVSTFRDHAL